ncbi:monocarboxylate transporter 12-like [Eriocheir sinensis]|uniref:monocarboxylate transporter 12-like n=1 Tax=Eriocheir sinensis TaxID=95602 RepID=UPI0021C5C190|nr:monocarboxylate transporter 12-like [Eriocheir sinensis]
MNVRLNGLLLEEVESFKYPGSHVAVNGRVDVELLVGLTTQCFGILFLGFLTELKTSSALIGWIYSLVFTFSSFFSYFLEPLVSKYGWRMVAFSLGVVNGVGLALSAFATSGSYLIFSYSFLAGMSVEMLYNLTYSIIPHYFTRWRGLANDIMTSGTPVNLLLMPNVLKCLLASYGFRGSVLITAGLALNICVAAMVLHPVEWHKKSVAHASKTKNKIISSKKEEKASLLDSLQTFICISGKNLFLIKSPTIVIICLVYAITYAGLFSITNVIPFALKDEGYELKDISLCLSMEGVGCLISKFFHSILPTMFKLKSQVTLLTGSTIMCTSIVGKIVFNE